MTNDHDPAATYSRERVDRAATAAFEALHAPSADGEGYYTHSKEFCAVVTALLVFAADSREELIGLLADVTISTVAIFDESLAKKQELGFVPEWSRPA
jgi:hypothetical protein